MNLDTAINTMIEGLRAVGEGKEWKTPRQKDYLDRSVESASYGRLRLDWELSFDAYQELVSKDEDAYDLLAQAIKFDLEDLIENGDVDSKDILLSIFNGAKKRGKEISNVEIVTAQIHKEFSQSNKRVGFTVYMLLLVEFE